MTTQKDVVVKMLNELYDAIDIIQVDSDWKKGDSDSKYCTIIHLPLNWKDFKRKYIKIVEDK
jgi:hypothetical protein